jgi:hypothetical protein
MADTKMRSRLGKRALLGKGQCNPQVIPVEMRRFRGLRVSDHFPEGGDRRTIGPQDGGIRLQCPTPSRVVVPSLAR